MKRTLTATLFAGLVLATSGCSRSDRNPSDPGGDNVETGGAKVLIHTRAVGILAKAGPLAKSARAIELAHLVVTLAAEGEPTLQDTTALGGNGEHTVARTFTRLAARKPWWLIAQSIDRRGVVIHADSATFTVQPGETADIRLSMQPFYSVANASFYPIAGAVSRVEMAVDGEVAADSSFAPGAVGDTVRLTFDYLRVGIRQITLNVYGGDPSSLMFTADTTLEVAAGQRTANRIRLRGRGNAEMSVLLGAVGEVNLNGELDLATGCAPSIHASWSDDLSGSSLGADWSVWQYSGLRHNGQSSPANHLEFPGNALRYALDPMTTVRLDHQPWWDGTWYWYDPALEVTRPLGGTRWTLEAKVEWQVPSVVNSAGFQISAQIGDPLGEHHDVTLFRYSNDDTRSGQQQPSNFISAYAGERSWTMLAPLQLVITRWVRLVREGDRTSVSLSEDSTRWTEVVSGTLPENLRCAPQRLLISGQAWFSPSGSRADYSSMQFIRRD